VAYPYEAASTAIGAAPLRPESLEGKLGLKYEEVLYGALWRAPNSLDRGPCCRDVRYGLGFLAGEEP
jgi:hypothetical protein